MRDCFLSASRKGGYRKCPDSRLEITPTGHATGRLAGLNCWGPEKVRRLIEYAGPKENYLLYAYGDSRGDREMLNLADNPFYREFH
jgi:phosphatidylglycerophosphatase C